MFKLTDLTEGPGVIPVRIQDSYRITKYYTYVHSINISHLQNGLDQITKLIKVVELKTQNSHSVPSLKEHVNYIQSKLDHIVLHTPKVRNKRGLINGLGNAISWLTGNMDANDKEYYDKVISKVEANSYHIEHNVEKQLAVNKKLIDDFYKELSVIQSNTKHVSDALSNNVLSEISFDQQYMYLLSNLMLISNKVNDIAISLEFCKSRTIHNSIITPTELTDIINHNNSLISTYPEILWQVGKVHCSLTNSHIHYFIQLPLEISPTETLFLLAYPYVNSIGEYKTFHVHPSLIIKDLLLYEGNCNLILNKYYCTDSKIVNDPCVNNLVLKDSNEQCTNFEIKKVDTFLNYVNIINQYLIHNVSRITISKYENETVIVPKLTMLLQLNEGEILKDAKNVYHYWESRPLKLQMNEPLNARKISIPFDKIHRLNIKMEPLELLEDTPTDSRNRYYLYVLPIIAFVCFMAHFIVKRYWTRRKQSSMTIVSQQEDSPPFHLIQPTAPAIPLQTFS